jgi:hypothetical protein
LRQNLELALRREVENHTEKDMRRSLIALALACAAAGAGAQNIYKLAMPGGAVVYTDNPGAFASAKRRLDLVAPLSPAPETGDILLARNDWRLAHWRRVSGVTPLEGERDGPRLLPGYWERQRALSQSLIAARARLAQAYVDAGSRP